MATRIVCALALVTGAAACSHGNDDFTEAQHQAIVDAHNAWRCNYGAPPMTAHEGARTLAREWARHIADDFKNNWGHRPSGSGYGENLAMNTIAGSAPSVYVDMWGDEVQDYDYSSPGFSGATGHFTQVVWKDTTGVGCALASCPSDPYQIVVCNYYPPGNYYSQFPSNVLPPTTCGSNPPLPPPPPACTSSSCSAGVCESATCSNDQCVRTAAPAGTSCSGCGSSYGCQCSGSINSCVANPPPPPPPTPNTPPPPPPGPPSGDSHASAPYSYPSIRLTGSSWLSGIYTATINSDGTCDTMDNHNQDSTGCVYRLGSSCITRGPNYKIWGIQGDCNSRAGSWSTFASASPDTCSCTPTASVPICDCQKPPTSLSGYTLTPDADDCAYGNGNANCQSGSTCVDGPGLTHTCRCGNNYGPTCANVLGNQRCDLQFSLASGFPTGNTGWMGRYVEVEVERADGTKFSPGDWSQCGSTAATACKAVYRKRSGSSYANYYLRFFSGKWQITGSKTSNAAYAKISQDVTRLTDIPSECNDASSSTSCEEPWMVYTGTFIANHGITVSCVQASGTPSGGYPSWTANPAQTNTDVAVAELTTTKKVPVPATTIFAVVVASVCLAGAAVIVAIVIVRRRQVPTEDVEEELLA